MLTTVLLKDFANFVFMCKLLKVKLQLTVNYIIYTSRGKVLLFSISYREVLTRDHLWHDNLYTIVSKVLTYTFCILTHPNWPSFASNITIS